MSSNQRFISPSFVDDGQAVIVPLMNGSTNGIRGTVTCAAGYHARVQTRLWERWFHIDELRIEIH